MKPRKQQVINLYAMEGQRSKHVRSIVIAIRDAGTTEKSKDHAKNCVHYL